MIGNRVMFGCILLFLTLVITISTAPIYDIKLEEVSTDQTITTTEPITYDNDSSESNEQDIETTTIPEVVVTNSLLFNDTTELVIDIDEIIKMTDRLFSEHQDELPSTPTTENPEPSQTNTYDDDDE